MLSWLSVAYALDGYVVPTLSYDTDDQLGGGLRGELAWPSDDPELPYRLSLVAQGYVATSGFQHHRFRLDRPGLGQRGRGRLTLHVAWRQWLSDKYYGVGNDTLRERVYLVSFERDDPARRYYQYALYQPFLHLTWRRRLGEGPFELFLALNPKWSVVRPYAGSLLEEQQPYGLEGGATAQGFAGVLHDTRQPEIAPRRGHLFELSARYAPRLMGEAGGFGGALGSMRLFAPAGERVVLAGRLMAEHLSGDIPFYELVHWGGAIPVAGMGGAETLRGVTFGRWRAPGKGIANAELRWSMAELAVAGDPLVIELSPFVDAGLVWGEGPLGAPHPAAGGGVRLVYAETFVGRMDSGLAYDPILEPDGTVSPALAFGFYLTFDHPF
jgi:hypothetical protein